MQGVKTEEKVRKHNDPSGSVDARVKISHREEGNKTNKKTRPCYRARTASISKKTEHTPSVTLLVDSQIGVDANVLASGEPSWKQRSGHLSVIADPARSRLERQEHRVLFIALCEGRAGPPCVPQARMFC